MKYIDAEKLKAEIQKRSMHAYEAITADEPQYRTHYKLGRYEGLRDLIDFIDSLQQEQPSLPSNLDEAAKEYAETTSIKVWGRIDPKKDLKGFLARANYATGLLDGFIAGAEWMAEQGETVAGTFHHSRGYPSVIELKTYLRDYEGEDVIVQIRKKED